MHVIIVVVELYLIQNRLYVSWDRCNVLVSELLSFVCNRGCCSSSFYKPLASVFIFQNVEYVLSQIIPLVVLASVSY